MKKVILIGGTAYSGSTILDLILSNTNKGISVGELHALFFPWREKQLDYGGIDTNKGFIKFWDEIKNKSYKNVYKNIFDKFPEKEYIVDSSKAIYWIYLQNKLLEKQDFEIKNILIWKNPESLVKSYLKRGKNNALDSWINYYRQYLSIIKNPIIVNLDNFINNSLQLKSICQHLSIPYSEKMFEYWNNETAYTLYGSTSAKISLYNPNSESYRKAKSIIDSRNKDNRYYYRKVEKEKNKEENLINIFENPQINDQIYKIKNFLIGKNKLDESILFPKKYIKLKLYKHLIRSFLFRTKILKFLRQLKS
ncbi:MAG: hypothetical protein ACOCP8_06020 [archaeon]